MEQTASERHWERVLVYGLGASGRAATRLLRRRGIAVVAVDSRDEDRLELGDLSTDPAVEWRLGAEPEALPAGVDAVVVSPGVPMQRPLVRGARAAGLPVLSEVELAFPWLDGEVVAITGSNGKSTTTALTGALLEAAGFSVAVCGNIGLPLSACVDGPPGRVFVVELSSFQLEGVAEFRPRAAALLNLAPDHLDRYPSFGEYARAKARIFARQQAGDTAVLNADDDRLAEWTSGLLARRRFFSRAGRVEDGCFLDGERVVEVSPDEPSRELFTRPELPLAGPHNLENAMAASLLARTLGALVEPMRRALAGFRGLPHRLERVAERGGVVFYDDSKGTNFAATEKSLGGFADRSVHLILGGRNKGGDPGTLRDSIRQKVLRLYLIGESAAELESAFGDLVELDNVGDLEAAVRTAARQARRGEAVVLSPACASFDQFRDFVHRGQTFQALVRGLEEDG